MEVLMGNGYRHYAGLKGTKILQVGADETAFPYQTLEAALLDAQNGDVIYLEHGTYSLSAAQTIQRDLTIIGRGRVVIDGDTAGLAARLFMLNKPASGTAATYIRFENIIFENAFAAADCVEIDTDGGASGAMYVDFINCSFDAEATGYALDVDQTTNTIDLYVNVIGRLGLSLDNCSVALSKAASMFNVVGYDLGASVIATGATDVASIHQFQNCVFGSAAAVTGGATNVIYNYINCVNKSSGEVRNLNYADVDSTGHENIVGSIDTPVCLLVGAAGSIYPYSSLIAAVAAANAGDSIYLEPGSHTLAATLTLDKNISLIGKGRCTVTGAVAGRLIMINKPAAGATATYVRLENLLLVNTSAGADVVEIDNDGGGTAALYADFIDCSFTSNAGVGLDVDQSTAGEDLYVLVKGRLGLNLDSCTFSLEKAASSVSVIGYDVGASTFTLGAVDVASIYQFQNCIFGSAAAVSGGAASVLMNFLGCSNKSSGSIRSLAFADVDATGVENIVGSYDSPKCILVSASSSSSYATLAAAVAAAAAGDVIYLEPGSHTVAATVTINKDLTIIGHGRCVVTGAVADRMIMLNKPAAGTAGTYIKFQNIDFVNTSAGADCVESDNDGGSTGALYISFLDCSFTANAGLALDLDQTTNTEDVFLYIKGDGRKEKPMDSMDLALSKATSEVTIDGVDFLAADSIAIGAAAVACLYNFKNMSYAQAAFTTGGNAAQVVNIWNCITKAAAAIGIAAAGDFDSTAASENIIPAS
jgi:hypothetical protein